VPSALPSPLTTLPLSLIGLHLPHLSFPSSSSSSVSVSSAFLPTPLPRFAFLWPPPAPPFPLPVSAPLPLSPPVPSFGFFPSFPACFCVFSYYLRYRTEPPLDKGHLPCPLHFPPRPPLLPSARLAPLANHLSSFLTPRYVSSPPSSFQSHILHRRSFHDLTFQGAPFHRPPPSPQPLPCPLRRQTLR